MQLQMKQQQMKDQQTIMQIASQFEGGLANPEALSALSGKISAATFIPLQKSLVDMRKDSAAASKDEIDNRIKTGDEMTGLITQAKQLPPDQYMQAWPQIFQKATEIDPRITKHLNPSQPVPQQALDGIALGYATHTQIASMEAEKRSAAKAPIDIAKDQAQTAEALANAEKTKLETTMGGNQGFADSRYRNIKMNQQLGRPVSAEDTAFLSAYDAQKKASQPYGAARIEIAREGLNQREATADKKDQDFIDKTYVKPANDAEKSYQMFMDAYNNRNNAKTGAESMLALSTHLATTFGNVKGARVTKDMIQEHLGARGISDKVLVAVQSLTNGDVLSPDQWDAFKDLISNSRKLSWDTVQKEADRRKVDVSGSLPADLKKSAAGSYFDQYPTH